MKIPSNELCVLDELSARSDCFTKNVCNDSLCKKKIPAGVQSGGESKGIESLVI